MKSQNNQLKSADIGHEFGVLPKTKHVGHDSNSILVPEFEFDHDILNFLKMQNSQNLVEQSKQILKILCFYEFQINMVKFKLRDKN